MENKLTQASAAFLNKIKADGVSIIEGSSFDRPENENIINSDIPFGGDMREYGYAMDNIYGDFERFYSQRKKPPEKDFDTGRKIHKTFQEAVEMQFPKKDGGHYTEAEMTEWEAVFERYEKEGYVPDSNNYGFNHFDAKVGSKKVLSQIMELQTGVPYVLAELKGINQGEEVIAVIPENLYSDEYVKSLETEYLNFNGAERGTEKAVEGYVSTPARYEIIFNIMANNNCRLEFGALNGDMAEAFIKGNASNDEILRFSYDEKSDVDFAQKLIEKANSLSLLDSPYTKLVRKIADEIAKEYEKKLSQENEKIIPARSDDGNVSEYDFRDKIEDAIIADKKIGKKYRAAFDLDEKLDIHGLDDLRVEMLQTLVEVVGNGERNVSKEEVVNIADGMLNSGGYVEKARKAKQWEFAEKEEFVDPVRVMAMDALGLDAAIEVFGTVDKPKEVSHELQEELRSLSSSLRLQGVGAKPTLQDIEKIKELAGLSENTSARYVDEFHLTGQNSVTVGHEEKFLEAVKKYLKDGVAPTYNEFEMSETPKILQYAGIQNHKIFMTTKVINKAKDEAHNLDDGEILSALKGFSNPVIVFDSDKEKSEAKGKSVLIFTEATDRNNKPLAIGFEVEIQKRGTSENYIVNQIRSVHSRSTLINSRDENMLEKWAEKGLVRYVDDKKISEWLKDRQVQFPLSLTNLDEISITDSSGNVKNFPVKTKSGFESQDRKIQKMLAESAEKHYGLDRQEDFSRRFYNDEQDENIVKEKIMENQNVESIMLALDAFKNGYQVPKHDDLDEYSEKTLVRNRGWNVYASKADYGEDFNTTIELGDTISPESLVDGISDAYEIFDVDKHAEMWIEAKNKNVRDVPQSISNLVEDAKSIDKKLQNIDKDAARLNWQHSNGRTMTLEEPKKETPSVNATPFERVAENVKKTLAKNGSDINAMSTTTIMTAFAKSIQTLSQKDKEAFSRQLIEMGGISKGSVEKLILKAAGKEITKENRKLRDDYGIGR